MKNIIKSHLSEAIELLKDAGELPADFSANIMVEYARDKALGDYASNVAMVNAKNAKMSPRDFATLLKSKLSCGTLFSDISIAGPGFLNFTLNAGQKTTVITDVLKAGDSYGENNDGDGKRVLVEFVSANPTGPLHVGHGRGAALGATLANVLKASGYDVSREYYVNDAGRQMKILAVSLWCRYLMLLDETLPFPANGYQGQYVIDMAKDFKARHGDAFLQARADIFDNLPLDEPKGGDKEIYIDALCQRAKTLLGDDGFEVVLDFALNEVLKGIEDDLNAFGVPFDNWFSEKSLINDGALDKGINALVEKETTYCKEEALWFKSTDFGDDKDRVLKRANGETTYFASDVAYHWNKFARGFDVLIDIFGADHHGYVTRVKAACDALGQKSQALEVRLVQFAILYRGDERLAMSTRSGEFVTLSELCQEVGRDAARFFYVMRKSDQHMDFDLELAKSQTNDNPVYYIQYAHARICSIFNALEEKGWQYDEEAGLAKLEQLNSSEALSLCDVLAKYKEVVALSARQYEPHHIAYYLKELATAFHSFYNAHQLLVDDECQRNAHLCLVKACQQVLRNGLSLLGVSAPRRM